MSRSCVGDDRVLVVAVVVDDGCDRLPAVLDVVKVPPHVAAVDDRSVVGLQIGTRKVIMKKELDSPKYI